MHLSVILPLGTVATWFVLAPFLGPMMMAAAAPMPTHHAAGASSSSCPAGMRLVEGTHPDRIEYECNAVKWGMCSGYRPGVALESGPVTHERVCMDEFEAPNVRGQRPIVMLTGTQAVAWCSAHGKRLCSEAEWEVACDGPERLPYGYGWTVDGTCNQEKPWRSPDAFVLLRGTPDESARELAKLWQGEVSGARAGCVTAAGVHDMVGNVEEWVSATRIAGRRPVLVGGHWAKPWSQCRDPNYAHVGDVAFTYYEVGLRCCEDPP